MLKKSKTLNYKSFNFKEFCIYFLFITFLFSKFSLQFYGVRVSLWEIATFFMIISIFNEKKLIFDKINIYCVILFTVYIFSFILNTNFLLELKIKELTLLIQIIRCLIIFLIIYNFYNEIEIEKIFKFIYYIILFYLLICFSLHLGFYEILGHQDALDIINQFGRKYRLQGFGLGPNYLAWILIFPLFYSLFLNKKFYLCFFLFALYLTGSRTLMFILILYIVIFFTLKLKVKHIKYLSLILTSILFLAWDNYFYLWFKTPRWEIYQYVFQLLNDSSFLDILLGHGPRSLYYNLINSDDIFNKYSHNSYIDIFFDFGLVFFLICLFGIIQTLKIIYQLFRHNNNNSFINLSKSLSFFIITYLIAMIFFSYFYLPIFWFFLAFLMLINKRLKQDNLHNKIIIYKKK